MNDQNTSIDLNEVFQIIKKRKHIIIWITLISTILTAAVTVFFIKPTYQASESVIVSKQDTGTQAAAAYNYNDVLMYQNLLKTYAAIAQNKSVAQKTIDNLNLNMKPGALLGQVKVTPRQNTQIMDISVTSKNPEEAYKIAKEFTDDFIKRANELLPTGSITVLQEAELPLSPIKPSLKLNVSIAFILGLMTSLGIIFFIEYSDNTIKTEKDVEKILEIPVIGIIPLEVRR